MLYKVANYSIFSPTKLTQKTSNNESSTEADSKTHPTVHNNLETHTRKADYTQKKRFFPIAQRVQIKVPLTFGVKFNFKAREWKSGNLKNTFRMI